MRLSAEVDLPASEADSFRMAMRVLCEGVPEWKLLSVGDMPLDPPCPACGMPMEWDRDFAGYVCHHTA